MSRRTTYFLFISFVALAAFLMVGLASTHARDWPFAQDKSFQDVRNLAGPLGSLLAFICRGLLGGLFAWFVPLSLLVLGVGLLAERTTRSAKLILKSFAIVVLLTSFFALMPLTRGSSVLTGSIGTTSARLVSSVLGEFGGTIVLITCLLLILLTELRHAAKAGFNVLGQAPLYGRAIAEWFGSLSRRIERSVEAAMERRERRQRVTLEPTDWGPPPPERQGSASTRMPDDAPWLEVDSAPTPKPRKAARALPAKRAATAVAAKPALPPGPGIPLEKATLPPMSILQSGADARSGYSADQLKSWSEVHEFL